MATKEFTKQEVIDKLMDNIRKCEIIISAPLQSKHLYVVVSSDDKDTYVVKDGKVVVNGFNIDNVSLYTEKEALNMAQTLNGNVINGAGVEIKFDAMTHLEFTKRTLKTLKNMLNMLK